LFIITNKLEVLENSLFLFVGIRVKPQTTQFHLTLAYNFDLSKTDDLSQLAKNVKLESAVRWELNVYSRNIKYNGKQVRSINYDHPQNY